MKVERPSGSGQLAAGQSLGGRGLLLREIGLDFVEELVGARFVDPETIGEVVQCLVFFVRDRVVGKCDGGREDEGDLGSRLVLPQGAHDLLHPRGTAFVGDVFARRIEHGVHVRAANRIVGEVAERALEDLPLLAKTAVADLLLDRVARALDDRDLAAQTSAMPQETPR